MAKANQPDRDLAAQDRSRIDNLATGLTGDRMADDDILLTDPAELTAEQGRTATKTKAAQAQTTAQSTGMQSKKGNQPPANPPKR